ncbi:MAG: DUF5688 family protein [Lachnospiraceae bacterium]|nr:DUF5688 family protein [Lachnospiraceae bacterium]
MTLREFTEELKTRIEEIVSDDTIVKVDEVMKNNSVKLLALSIRRKDEALAPTIYTEEYFNHYNDGEISMEEIVNSVLKIYSTYASGPNLNFDFDRFEDYETMRDSIIFRLVNYDRNRELLEDVPHRRYMDLAVIYCCLLKDFENGTGATTVVKKAIMEQWGVTEEELYRTAIKNSPDLLKVRITPMNEMLSYSPECFTGPEMFVFSNEEMVNGASCLLYPGVLKTFANNIHSDLIILPSSVHELILIPGSQIEDVKGLSGLVRQVNESEVEEKEILSNNVYKYSLEGDRVEMVV